MNHSLFANNHPKTRIYPLPSQGLRLLITLFIFLITPTIAIAITPQCNTANIQAMANSNTHIIEAKLMAQPVSHCLIDGQIITTNPGPNAVDFRLQLPTDNWNGRYYFIGLGGTGGYLPTQSQVPAGSPLLKGFAVAGTNTGHYSPSDWSFLATSPAKAMDHIHRAAHVSAQSSQNITKQFYGTDTLYRYHSGCSGGGRMGLAALTMHPEDYDGLLIGAPGIGPQRGTETMLGFIYMGQQLNREDGAWLSPAKLKFADQHVTAHCDALDGATDNMVWNPNACTFDFNTLACKTTASSNTCLTAAEITTINALLAGPSSPKGVIKGGMPISNMAIWSRFIGHVPPPWPDIDVQSEQGLEKGSPGYLMANTLAQAYFGKEFNSLEDFDFNDQSMVDNWWAAANRIGYGAPFSLNLAPYKKQGGKVIFWNGVSDPCCSDNDLEKYYREASPSVGGMSAMQSMATLYRIPGMGHCGSGTGPHDTPDRLFEALMAWVEKGEKPQDITVHRGHDAELLFVEKVTSTQSGVPVPAAKGGDRDFLLCPFPSISVFNGKHGNELNAKHWSCQQP